MTTQELYDLARGHEGKPWWPEDCKWNRHVTFLWVGGEPVSNDAAIEAMFIGSAVKWLVENNYHHIFLRKYAADRYEASMTITLSHERTSLLAALLAMCEAVEAGR